jgi:hypothetical protein
MSCVLSCRYVFGSYFRVGPVGPLSGGEVVDMADPSNPKVIGDWTDGDVLPSRKVHDVTEVAPGILVTASAPIEVLDARGDPAKPRVIARGPDPGKRYHSVVWPRNGRDRFILGDFETNATPRCEAGGGDFSTFDASEIGTSRGVTEFKRIDSYYLANGNFGDGNPVANGLGCSPHWFSVRPSWADGGVVALGAYDHGTKFLRVDPTGKISEIGHLLAPGTNASAAYWITCDIVYSVDYTRGLDVMRFSDPQSDCPPEPSPASGSGHPAVCVGPAAPRVRVRRLRLRRRGLSASGTAAAVRCGGRLGRVQLLVARKTASRCRFVGVRGRLGRARRCSTRNVRGLAARGSRRWRLRLRARLPRGRYLAWVRAIDTFGAVKQPPALRRRLR